MFSAIKPPQPVLGIYLHHVHVCDSTCQRRLWRQLHEQFHLSVLLLHIRTDDTEPHHDVRRKLYRRIDGAEREPLQYAPRQILPAMYLSGHPFPVQPYPGLHGYNSSAYVNSLSMFTMGTIFAMMMQMAVYNNKTAPLNTNTIGKQQGNNMYQSLIVICAFSLPLLINKALTLFLDETTAYIILIILGLSGFVTHRYWIHNIYVRLMKRKYQNMEGFRNTR